MAEGQGPHAGGHTGQRYGARDHTKRLAIALAAVKIGQRSPADLRIFGDRLVSGELIKEHR